MFWGFLKMNSLITFLGKNCRSFRCEKRWYSEVIYSLISQRSKIFYKRKCFIFRLTQYIQINLHCLLITNEPACIGKQVSCFLSNTWIERISLSLIITDMGYFMTCMYMTFKKLVAKTRFLTDVKTRELECFSHFKSTCKWNEEKTLTAGQGHPEALLMTN